MCIRDSASRGNGAAAPPDMTAAATPQAGMQLSFFQLDDPVLAQVRDELLGIDIDRLTPLQALTKLNDIQAILSGKSK